MSERRLAPITGATGPTGYATAIALARTGEFDLALYYRSAGSKKREVLKHKIQEADSAYLNVGFFQADLGDAESIRRSHSAITSSMRHVDASSKTSNRTKESQTSRALLIPLQKLPIGRGR